MATIKTLRLTEQQASWLAQTSTSSGISENKIVAMLIDRARRDRLGLIVTLKPADPGLTDA